MRLIKIRWNKRATHLLRLLISLSLLLWLGFTIRWPELEQALLQVEVIWLLAAAGLVILSMLISVRKWQVLLQAQGMSVPWVELWKAYWVGLFFNNFLPSSIGGDAVRILWVGKRGQDVPGAAASVIMERIIATAGLALTGFLGAGLLASPDRHALILFGILLAASQMPNKISACRSGEAREKVNWGVFRVLWPDMAGACGARGRNCWWYCSSPLFFR